MAEARLYQLAELCFLQPASTWTDKARALSPPVTDRTVLNWRHDPRWPDIFREVGSRYVNALVPHAIQALRKAFDNGTASKEAILVLQGAGLLNAPASALSVHHSGAVAHIDIQAKLEALTAGILGTQLDDQHQPGDGYAPRLLEPHSELGSVPENDPDRQSRPLSTDE